MSVSQKIVVFDLGKVLLDFDYMRAAGKLMPLCGVFPLKIASVFMNSGLLEELELGEITDDEFFEEVSRLLKFKGTREDFLTIFGDIFDPIEEMIAFQANLKQRGVSTYIFSNTNDTAVRWIGEHYPFFNQFDGYFFSYKLKVAKPDERFYIALEEQTGRKGSDIIYLDDRKENVEAAVQRGWRTVLLSFGLFREREKDDDR